MYCPNCSQEQAAGNLKFCSRCGMPMGLVARLLNNGGRLPELEELAKTQSGWFTRKNGIIFSLFWFIFWVPFGAAMWGGVFGVEELAAASAIFGVFSSILIFLFSLFFLKSASATSADIGQTTQEMGGVSQQYGALPPQQAQSAQDFVSPGMASWSAPDTGDLVQPGSVTETTTRLLRKEDE